MKDGGWIPVDKRLVNLLPKDREYTFLEAYISLRIDIENEAEISINGYARMWSWSRNKVRYFVDGLRTGKGHSVDTQRTGKGQEIRLIYKQLEEDKDSPRTGKGQSKDRQGTITINNKEKEETIRPYKEILDDLNFKGGFSYRPGKAINEFINGRLSEGYTKEDFFHVHSVKIKEWANHPKMAKFLRPSTLYRPSHFQEYLNQKIKLTQTIRNADGELIEVPV